jgi:hypothetical protein
MRLPRSVAIWLGRRPAEISSRVRGAVLAVRGPAPITLGAGGAEGPLGAER